MSASKGKLMKRPITDFIAAIKDNERWSDKEDTGYGFTVDTYGLRELEEKIVDSEAILTPLVARVKGNKLETGVGNRRTLAGQNLKSKGKKLADYILTEFPGLFFDRNPKTGLLSTDRNDRDPEAVAESLMKALDNVPVEVHDNPSDEEWDEILHDKGKEKRIRKSETLKACYKLWTKGRSEKQVARIMFHQLADVTGNVTKIDYINSITDPRKRDQELTKWLHGTLGGFWMSIWGHSKRMRDCLMLTFLREDKLIPVDEQGNPKFKPEFIMTHNRWRALQKAIKEDHSKGLCAENAETSPSFEIQVQKFKDEDNGIKGPRGPVDTRIKQDQLLNMAKQDTYDPTTQLALRVAAGAASGDELMKASEGNLRTQGVMDILRKAVDFIPKEKKFTGAQVNDLLNGIVRDVPMEFVKVVTPFLNKEGQELLAGQAVAMAETPKVTAAPAAVS